MRGATRVLHARLGLHKLLGSAVTPVAHEGLSRIIRVAPRAVYSVHIVMSREFCGKPVKNDVLQVLHIVATISRHVLHETRVDMMDVACYM